MDEDGGEMNFMVSLRGGFSFGLNGAFWNSLFQFKGKVDFRIRKVGRGSKPFRFNKLPN